MEVLVVQVVHFVADLAGNITSVSNQNLGSSSSCPFKQPSTPGNTVIALT